MKRIGGFILVLAIVTAFAVGAYKILDQPVPGIGPALNSEQLQAPVEDANIAYKSYGDRADSQLIQMQGYYFCP